MGWCLAVWKFVPISNWRGRVVAAVLLAGVPLTCYAAESVLSDFNGTGFSFTFDNFAEQTGPSSVRVYSSPLDEDPGWGGAGINFSPMLNLSSLAGGRWVVDMAVNPANAVNSFTMEIYDTSDRSGKWTMNVGGITPGVPTRLVSSTTMADPTSGTGDWQNLDLSQIRSMNVLGEWMSPSVFDIGFDRVAISDDVEPPPLYAGAEPDAPWRAEAAARIDAIRKADVQITATDSLGNPLPGAGVGVHMQRHAFGFGTAVQAYRLRDNDPAHDTYKQMVDELFNVATIENNLKWPPWNGQWGDNFTQQGAENAVAWLNGHDIAVRGHNLIWPGYSNLPQTIQSVLDGAPLGAAEQQQVRDLIAAHIADEAGRFAGQLAAWDVINETRTNHDVMDNLPEGNLAMVDWFQQARAADAEAKLYLNDYGILTSGGGTHTADQQLYYDTIKFLQDNGAPIDGIGFQGHFSPDSLTGPEQLWTIFDRFAELALDMQITEFDLSTDDEELQAQYQRDLMTAVFAHEGFNAFLAWGFWEDAHWRPDAAMFRSDWSIKPNGQAYLDLVFGDWWTDEDVSADESGQATVRAFKGEHEISASFGEFAQVMSATLGDGGLELQIALPFVLGDYNRDGEVGAADYVVWRKSFGEIVDRGTGADGDGDGEITMADYGVWRQHFGAAMTGAGSASHVPEPATWLLAVGGGAAWFAASRRRIKKPGRAGTPQFCVGGSACPRQALGMAPAAR